jgi:hypothetical protein
MKLYRFIPNTRDYRSLSRHLIGRWWPDGIDLGEFIDELYPRPADGTWPHEGNRFESGPEGKALSDFPALALNVPLLSERAAGALRGLSGLELAAELTIDGQRFFGAQPRPSPGAFREAASSGLAMPNGEVFFYYRRSFDVAKIEAEFFQTDALDPFSDLYVTDRLVSAATAAGLTGLEYLELVFDEEGPVVPRYPRRDVGDLWMVPPGRGKMEYFLIEWRCTMGAYDQGEIRDAFLRAVAEGYIAVEDMRPAYER